MIINSKDLLISNSLVSSFAATKNRYEKSEIVKCKRCIVIRNA